MSCSIRLPGEPLPPCQHPAPNEADPAKLCGAWAECARVVDGAMLKVCVRHAGDVDAQRNPRHHHTDPLRPTPEEREEERRMQNARWDAEQAKLPPHKRRTMEQADADDEADMGRKLRRASRKGVL
jgi:hypothetical protein